MEILFLKIIVVNRKNTFMIKTFFLILYGIYCVVALGTLFYIIIRGVIQFIKRKINQIKNFVIKIRERKRADLPIFDLKNWYKKNFTNYPYV